MNYQREIHRRLTAEKRKLEQQLDATRVRRLRTLLQTCDPNQDPTGYDAARARIAEIDRQLVTLEDQARQQGPKART